MARFGNDVAEMRKAMNRVLAIDGSGATVFRVAYEVVFEGKGAPNSPPTAKYSAPKTTEPTKTPEKQMEITDAERIRAIAGIVQPASGKQPSTPSPFPRTKRGADDAFAQPERADMSERSGKFSKIAFENLDDDDDDDDDGGHATLQTQVLGESQKHPQEELESDVAEKRGRRSKRSGKTPKKK